jgi:hypothetical protein
VRRIALVVIFLIAFITYTFSANVSGTIRYRNKTYDANGFQDSSLWNWLPVRHAIVEVIKVDGAVETSLGTGSTDNNGYYTITIPNAGSQTIFIRTYAKQDTFPYNIVVKNDPTNNQIYTAVSTQALLDTNMDQTINLDIPLLEDGGIAEVFNIFDVAVWSYQYINNLGAMPNPPPLLTIYWYDGSTDGSYFDPSTSSIHLLGKSSDPDQFDDDIILHEVGHFSAQKWSKDDNPGGAHTITGQYDPRLTWSEGWAHYFSTAVRVFAGSSLYPQPHIIVDNLATGANSFDIELPSEPNLTIMASNEIAVAAVILDFMDDTSSEVLDVGVYDSLFLNHDKIWNGFSALTTLSSTNYATVEDFYIKLQITNALTATEVSYAEGILKARKIRYYVDTKENNNSDLTATLIDFAGSTQATVSELTFYPVDAPNYTSLDRNWFKFEFTGGTVTIRTLNLGDWCDTYLELFDSGLSPLGYNDNKFAGDYSSEIITTLSSGTYYIRCRPSTATGPIVEFGYYDLLVTLEEDISTPSAFTLSSPPDGSFIYQNCVTLKWNPSHHLTGVSYKIIVSMDPMFGTYSTYYTSSTYLTLYNLANKQFFWQVTAIAGNGNQTTTNIWSFLILHYAPSASPTGIPIQGGSEVSDYIMVSSPVDLHGTDSQQLEANLGMYAPHLWRMFRWKTSHYIEYPYVLPMKPGRGFWLISSRDCTLSFTGYSLHQLDRFYIKLKPGWNQIAVPFTNPVNWSDVICLQKQDGTVVQYNADDLSNTLILPYLFFWKKEYVLSDQLVPYYGYFVKNITGADVLLRITNPGPILPKSTYKPVPEGVELPPMPPSGLTKSDSKSSGRRCFGEVSTNSGTTCFLLILFILLFGFLIRRSFS